MNAREKEKQDAVRELREILKPGDTVYTKLEHVSRSGMSRVISPYIIRDNEPVCLEWKVGKALGWPLTPTGSRHEGIRVSGCGMDMGFHLVYTLSRVLFPDGFMCKGCHLSDKPHQHNDGGYALKQRWL